VAATDEDEDSPYNEKENASSWDELSGDTQEKTEEAWIENNLSDLVNPKRKLARGSQRARASGGVRKEVLDDEDFARRPSRRPSTRPDWIISPRADSLDEAFKGLAGPSRPRLEEQDRSIDDTVD